MFDSACCCGDAPTIAGRAVIRVATTSAHPTVTVSAAVELCMTTLLHDELHAALRQAPHR
ncbi:hypothetical protein [Amycolatopsis sp. NPDC098790]|uniref:hypothetical protein n=1 Tax=Amycolatopsis sp. NPDC098790 TaxID=3363939 RepID=UPI003829EC5A